MGRFLNHAVRKRRNRSNTVPPMVVTIPCRIRGKLHVMILTRQDYRVKLVLSDPNPKTIGKTLAQSVKDAIIVEEGEALHTALHALGIFDWGQH